MRKYTILSIVMMFAAAAMIPMGAHAQGGDATSSCDLDGVHCCGDLELVFLNPDLQPRSDGKIHAQGSIFAQFQAIGDQADEIATFAFSFGPLVSEDAFTEDTVCDLPLWHSGQAVPFYRADQNPDDGFFINLQTNLVPDGEYTAAVHAYDADDEELARFWANAVVDNCEDSGTPIPERCDEAGVKLMDKTMPWPIVLPGDGQLPDDKTGFTIEFAENLHPDDPIKVTLNGEDITDELETWDGREWDNDYFLGYYPFGLAEVLPSECSQQPPQDCTTLGPAYKWEQRDLTDDDVLRVEAMDASIHSNAATKDLHIGSGITGGAISDQIPILTWQFDRVSAEVDLENAVTPIFKAKLTNSGNQEGHPFADTEVPEGWEAEWNPPHKPVPPGASTEQELAITVPSDAAPGDYQINATMTYAAGGTDKALEQVVVVTVLGEGEGDIDIDLQEQDDDGDEESPGAGFIALAVVVAAVVVAVRRRS